MNASTPGKIRRAFRIIVWLLIGGVVLVFAIGLILWREPLWIAERLTEFRLYRAAIHSSSMIIDGYNVHYIEGGMATWYLHGLGSQAQNDWGSWHRTWFGPGITSTRWICLVTDDPRNLPITPIRFPRSLSSSKRFSMPIT